MLTRLAFLSSAAVAAAASSLPRPARAENADLQARLQAIVDDYARRAHAAGIPASVVAPTVALEMTPVVAVYANGNRILVAEYGQMPPPVQQLFDGWAGYAGWTGKHLVDEMFNWFIIPHELTHWAQTRGGVRGLASDRFGTESEANRVAIAYWSREPADRARLAALVTALSAIKAKLPNPVPAGSDAISYFEANYAMLGRDGAAYGWYQLGMIVDAYAAGVPSLDDALRAIATRPALPQDATS